jgi:hypothetical protein
MIDNLKNVMESKRMPLESRRAHVKKSMSQRMMKKIEFLEETKELQLDPLETEEHEEKLETYEELSGDVSP